MIFAIMLTLAYILYYATMVTFDLTAKSKSDTAKEEVISAADGQEEEYAPKSVVENTETGGFSFVDNVPQEESQQEKIEEAEEEKVQESIDSLQNNEQTATDNVEDQSRIRTCADVDDHISEETETVVEQEEAAPGEEVAEEDAPSDEEELPNLSTVNYEEQKEEEPHDNEPFDESKVFDPELSQPKYGVATIVEPEYSDELVSHANEVNDALSSIDVRDNGCDPFVLANVIRDKALADSKNIETEDEVTRY